MTEETTSKQLVEIDRDMADIERQVAELVEEAQRADYPQPQPQPQPEPIQVREGWWRTRRGEVKNIRPCEPLQGAHFVWPWTDGINTFQDNGRHLAAVSDNDLVEYLGPIEPDETQELPTKTQELLETGEESPDQLIGRISLLRRRVAQLEELVVSLRTINEGAEKAVSGAGVVNDSLRLQLAAVKAELATKAETSRRLQMELDAAQQVPADSPELRQLRADLAEVIRERDQYRHCYDEVSSHLETIEKTAKAEAIEAIVEWLVPIRTCGSQALATAVIANLPHIMRSLAGLEDEGIE